MLDIFRNNAFSVLSMTDRINKVPFVPGRAGQVIDWNEQGINSLFVAMEEQDGELKLINPSPRGSPGDTVKKPGRALRVLSVPHYQIDDAINADEVQGVREFGSENELQDVQSMVDRRMEDHVKLRLDPTIEFQRIGALRGRIVNANGSQLYDLYNEMGVAQPAPQVFVFGTADDGSIRQKGADATRVIANNLGGLPFASMYAFAGDAFYDALIRSKEARSTFIYQEGFKLRMGIGVYKTFEYGDITWENYRGGINGVPFIPSNEAIIFPVGVPGLFRTVFSPADYIETVNKIGLPRYSKQWNQPNDKGINMEVQTNSLSYCTRPNVLQRATIG